MELWGLNINLAAPDLVFVLRVVFRELSALLAFLIFYLSLFLGEVSCDEGLLAITPAIVQFSEFVFILFGIEG